VAQTRHTCTFPSGSCRLPRPPRGTRRASDPSGVDTEERNAHVRGFGVRRRNGTRAHPDPHRLRRRRRRRRRSHHRRDHGADPADRHRRHRLPGLRETTRGGVSRHHVRFEGITDDEGGTRIRMNTREYTGSFPWRGRSCRGGHRRPCPTVRPTTRHRRHRPDTSAPGRGRAEVPLAGRCRGGRADAVAGPPRRLGRHERRRSPTASPPTPRHLVEHGTTTSPRSPGAGCCVPSPTPHRCRRLTRRHRPHRLDGRVRTRPPRVPSARGGHRARPVATIQVVARLNTCSTPGGRRSPWSPAPTSSRPASSSSSSGHLPGARRVRRDQERGHLTISFRIILPLLKPVISAVVRGIAIHKRVAHPVPLHARQRSRVIATSPSASGVRTERSGR